MTPACGDLVAYAWVTGLVDTPYDLDLVERLAVEVEARREAYLDGQASIKAASVAVCQAADWPKIAAELDDARRARGYRARMLEPRVHDYAGAAVLGVKPMAVA